MRSKEGYVLSFDILYIRISQSLCSRRGICYIPTPHYQADLHPEQVSFDGYAHIMQLFAGAIATVRSIL